MKKRLFGFIALVFAASIMFSSCELLALFNFAKALGDWNYVYIKNDTTEAINVVVAEDPESIVADEETGEKAAAQNVNYSIKAGKTQEQAFFCGQVKVTIGDQQVVPSAAMATNDSYYYKPTSRGYYHTYAHSLMTISKEDGKYVYTLSSREE